MFRSTTLGNKAGVLVAVCVFVLFVGTTAFAKGYKLGAGDKLRITVLEWPDLTGEFRVGAGATVFMPMVGEVDANGITTKELAQRIAKKLRDKIQSDALPHCSIEVTEYRPFFVIGDVANPGNYEYRPGLTVLQAVSIAGGYYRETQGRDVFTTEGEVNVLARRAKELVAQIARLEAEHKNEKAIAFPKDVIWDSMADAPIKNGEIAIFQANNKALEKEVGAIDGFLILQRKEVKTIDTQLASSENHLKTVRKYFKNNEALAKKGLMNNARLVASKRTVAQLESNIFSLQATKLRVQRNLGDMEQRRIALFNKRTKRISEELQKARAEQKAVAFKLKAQSELLSSKAYGRTQDDVAFEIQRAREGAEERIPATSVSQVLPGDVVIVKRGVSGRASTTSGVRGNAQAPLIGAAPL